MPEKPLSKFIFLLLIRELYLFCRNLIGLIFHPYKTIRAIRREEDVSQAVLLSSWPISLWVPLSFLFLLVKFFFQPTGLLNKGMNLIFILMTIFTLAYAFYIVSWLIFYFQVNRGLKK